MSEPRVDAEREGVSIVMPAFNEEGAIADSVRQLLGVLRGLDRPSELLVVDDGSVDATAELARGAGARVFSLPRNRGYGAALKAGIARAKYDLIAITDADATYPHDALPKLLEHVRDYDMVVGARIGDEVHVPLQRRPAKWVLGKLASYLAGQPIPDLNSGQRVMKRALIERFAHLLPSGFSFTTTITLAALCSDHLVYYHPIDYHARVGESKIRPRHAFDFLLLIVRTVVYFNPLKVFLPLGAVFFAGGLAKFVYDLFIGNLSETALLGFLGAALLWALGLLSDQIARASLATRFR
jgi:glycosyltransferase involved in cell wall biosynthesis